MSRKIVIVSEVSGYYADNGHDVSQSRPIEAFEDIQDAVLSLWYWYLDNVDADIASEWYYDDTSGYARASTEYSNPWEDYVYRYTNTITLYG